MLLGMVVMKYEGVSKEEIMQRLGRQCSPKHEGGGYVIGPDIDGRLCHCSTHDSVGEAQAKARSLNNPSLDKFKQESDRSDT